MFDTLDELEDLADVEELEEDVLLDDALCDCVPDECEWDELTKVFEEDCFEDADDDEEDEDEELLKEF